MARLRLRIPVIDTDGTRQPGATVKLYAAGTASTVGSPASSTTGTPFAGALYAANSGGSALGTTAFTADANGDVVVFTETPARADIGVEIVNVGARVFPLEEFYYDPADLATAASTADMATKTGTETLTNKTLTAPTINAPAISEPTFSLPATAIAINRDGQVDAALLSLTQSNGSGGVATAHPALDVTRYTSGLGTAVHGLAVAAAGTGGSVVGGEFESQAEAGWNPSGGFIIGMKSNARGYVNGANMYGANIFSQVVQSGTSGSVVGIEVDPGGRVGTTVLSRYGVQAVSNDECVVQATGEDAAFRVAAKSLGAKWKTGLLIDSNGGAWCMDAAGVLIDARTGGNAAIGIDFSTVTFSQAFLKGPHTNINSLGRLHIGSSAGATGTMLKITNQLDDTNNFEIINPVTQTTVGAVGGASALPATPAGYLLARLGSTNVAIPYYLKS